MGSIKDKLNHLVVSKQAIHNMIENKGIKIPQGTPFRDYPQYIDKVNGGDMIVPPLTPWVRPAEWLDLPIPNDNEAYGLFLIGGFSQYEDTMILTSGTPFIVDWGDGNIINYTANEIAVHIYDFATISSPLTADGKKQAIIKITPQNGYTFTTFSTYVKPVDYLQYVRGVYDFKIQGSLLTSIVMRESYNLHLFELHGVNKLQTTNTLFYACHNLRRVNLFDTSTVTSFDNMFGICFSLEEVPHFNTSNGTNFNNFLTSCKILKTVPLFDTSKATQTANMFSACYNIKSFPNFNTSNVLNAQGMFTACTSLIKAPELDLSMCTNFSFMFSTCWNLQYVPPYDTSSATTTRYMFASCVSLPEIYPLDTSNVTDFSYMFSTCSRLMNIPQLDFTNVINTENMFQNCARLTSIPPINAVNLTRTRYMFQGCSILRTIPLFDTSKVTHAAAMFSSCLLLNELPDFDFSSAIEIDQIFNNSDCLTKVPTITSPFISGLISTAWYSMEVLEEVPPLDCTNVTGTINLQGTSNLRRIGLYNIPVSIDFQSTNMSREAIVEVFNNLLPAVGQTVNCRLNAGANKLTAEDIAIATNKGWTVITA